MGLHNAEKLVYWRERVCVCVCVCVRERGEREKRVNVHMYFCWSLLRTLSRNAPLFLRAHTYPVQPETILVSHGALHNLQTGTRQLRVKYFCWQLNASILSDLCLSTRCWSLGIISCCETMTYFKNTPVKAKNKDNYQYSFFSCHLQSRSHCMLTN
jgi:hypothetical protein